MITYHLIENTLIMKNKTTEEVLWQGRPYGCSIVKIMPLLDQSGCIVLLDQNDFSQSEYRHLSNLINISPKGAIKWAAQLPETRDVYVNFRFEEKSLFANSWSGFRVQIDLETGRILDRKFTK